MSLQPTHPRSLRVRLQAVPWSITERASELGVLLVHYSKPESAQSKPTWVVTIAPAAVPARNPRNRRQEMDDLLSHLEWLTTRISNDRW